MLTIRAIRDRRCSRDARVHWKRSFQLHSAGWQPASRVRQRCRTSERAVRVFVLALQQCEGFSFAVFDLVHGALARIFVRSPPEKSCAVSKPATGKVIIADFDDNFWRDRLPFSSALGAPATRSSRRVAGESGWFFQSLKFFC